MSTKVFIDHSVLRVFDKRKNCPLFWYRDVEFDCDVTVLKNTYLSLGEEVPPGLFSNLRPFEGKQIKLKRVERQIYDDDFLFASAPGYFEISEI